MFKCAAEVLLYNREKERDRFKKHWEGEEGELKIFWQKKKKEKTPLWNLLDFYQNQSKYFPSPMYGRARTPYRSSSTFLRLRSPPFHLVVQNVPRNKYSKRYSKFSQFFFYSNATIIHDKSENFAFQWRSSMDLTKLKQKFLFYNYSLTQLAYLYTFR